jgi:hypothetical protein
MPSEKELLERIRQLEQQNSVLQDKLDMIWSILAADYEDAALVHEDAGEDGDDGDDGGLVQIDQPHGKKPQ